MNPNSASMIPPPAALSLSNPAIDHACDIVRSYISNNAVSADRLPELIQSVHQAVKALYAPTAPTVVAPEELKPAVPVKRSIQPDGIICLEDGKKFKSLKRHLATHYQLSPDEYRAKWGLPADYPMVAPEYAAQRSRLAKEIGLGRKSVN